MKTKNNNFVSLLELLENERDPFLRTLLCSTYNATYNEALQAAAKNAKVKFIPDPDNFQTGGHYVVDQDSILKLMK